MGRWKRKSLLSFRAPSRVLETLTCNGSRKARPSLHPRELGSLLRRRNQKSVMEKLLFSWKFPILRSLTKEATSLLPRVRLEKLNPRLSPYKRSRLRWKLPKPPQNLCLLQQRSQVLKRKRRRLSRRRRRRKLKKKFPNLNCLHTSKTLSKKRARASR